MEFCRKRSCPIEDCQHHPSHALRGFAYTARDMDKGCKRLDDYLAGKAAKEERIQKMTHGIAYRIFHDIENPNVSTEEKGAAILKIIDMETHNSVTKAAMLKVIRWLWNQVFELTEEGQR